MSHRIPVAARSAPRFMLANPAALLRPVLVSAAVALAACNDPTKPAEEIRGTWAENIGIPGASLVITIDQTGSALSGSGTYSIEAGRSGTVQVTGSYVPPNVTLSMQYDYDAHTSFTGKVVGTALLRGSFEGSPGTVTFTRQ